MPTVDLERSLTCAGCYNFRDVGGYETAHGRRVRWRRLFRSDAIHRLTDDDLLTLRPLGIATILDLRSPQELAESGAGLLHAEPGVRHAHLPFFDEAPPTDPSRYAQPLADLYASMLDTAGPAIARVFTLLADGSTYPAVVHCAAGKDRTGITVALILAALGVPDETVVADYALTEAATQRWVADERAMGRGARFDGLPPHVLRAEATTMTETLRRLRDDHGSVPAYLDSIGVSPTQIDRLQDLLLA